MTFPRAGGVFRKYFLARERTIPLPPPTRIATHIAISMTDIIPILLIEFLIHNQSKTPPPKPETLLQTQAYALQKQRILQPAEMFQMRVFSEGHVQILHAEGEMLGEGVNGGGGYGGAGEERVGVAEGGGGGAEGGGEVC